MTVKKLYLTAILMGFLNQSCNKIFPDNINDSSLHQLKDSVYLDQAMKAILIMDKTSKDSFKVKKVIVNKIDSVYINTDKNIIYIINDKNEYISVTPDFKVEKLSHKPNVSFNSIYSW